MYVIENALLNVAKNRGRNILLGMVVFAIIVTTVVAVAICSTSDAIIAEYKARFGSEVTIAPKSQKITTSGGKTTELGDTITAEQTVAFAQSEYLQSADLSSSVGCYSGELTTIDQSDRKNPSIAGGRDRFGGDLTNATMRLRGNWFGDFADGKRELAIGSMPAADGECIVSTNLADLDHLSVGDSITLTADLYDADGKTRAVDIPLAIVGTYYDITDEYGAMSGQVAYQNRRNEILTTFDTVLHVQRDSLSGVAVNATYYLKSPDLLPAFEAEIRGKGLPDSYSVSTDEAGYQKMVGPVESLQSISLTFLIIVLVLGAVIMVLLSTIAIRERKYEIGVLRAIGMKKSKIALGLWTEIIAVTCICFCLGIGAGAALSQPVSDALLAGQVQPAATKSTGTTDVQPLEKIDVSVSGMAALEIFGISILLASIAGVASVSQITKYEPIKILMEQS